MSTTATYTHGKFVWFEHMSPDMARAGEFYNALFGWRTDAVPMGAEPYPMAMLGSEGIGGYRLATGKAPTHWIAFLSVPDVDASFAAVAAQGCRTMLAPTTHGPGRMAAVADPTGAAFALWQGEQGDRPDAPAPLGGWHWTELWTSDAAAALAFYERTFGFTSSAMPTPGGTYHMLMKDGIPRAGVMQHPQPGEKSMWLPYVSVADCDATVERAVALGATVCLPAMDMPQVGRFCVLMDPLGAAIGVIKVAQA